MDYRVFVVHYHLNRGGVTRVIESHLRSLAALDSASQPASVVVAFGGRREDWDASLADELPFELSLADVPALEYDSLSGDGRSSPAELAATLKRVLASCGCSAANTVLHVHNHGLGKSLRYR